MWDLFPSTLLKLLLSRSSVTYSWLSPVFLHLPWPIATPSVKCFLTRSPRHPSLSLSGFPFCATDSSLSVSSAWGLLFFIYIHSLQNPDYSFKRHLYANASPMPTSSLAISPELYMNCIDFHMSGCLVTTSTPVL